MSCRLRSFCQPGEDEYPTYKRFFTYLGVYLFDVLTVNQENIDSLNKIMKEVCET